MGLSINTQHCSHSLLENKDLGCLYFLSDEIENIWESNVPSNQYEEINAIADLLFSQLMKELFSLISFSLKQYYIDHDISDKEQLNNRHLPLFFKQYPLLKRRFETLTSNWVNNIKCFSSRWNTDKTLVARKVFNTEHIGTPQKIEVVGDSHYNGQHATIVHLSCGNIIVYKPRSLSIDAAFFDFAQQLNFINIFTPKFVLKENYGWMEYIPRSPLKTIEESKNYYYRFGLLLSLFYILEADDMHCENIIANEGYPVPIDLETLFHQGEDCIKNDLNSFISIKSIAHSILKSGVIPVSIGKGQPSYFAAIVDDPKSKVYSLNSVPYLHCGKNIFLAGFESSLISGFEQGYKKILSLQTKLMSGDSPLKLFENLRTRIMLRDTKIYSLLRKALSHPSNTQCELTTQKTLNKLDIDTSTRSFLNKVKDSEVQALLRSDIPSFSQNVSQTHLYCHGDKKISAFCHLSGIDLVRKKIAALSVDDLQTQVSMLKLVFKLRVGKNKIFDQNELSPDLSIPEQLNIITTSILENQLSPLTDTAWPALKSSQNEQYVTFTDHNLYNGNAGIAIYLAAYANCIDAPDTLKSRAISTVKKAIDCSYQRALATPEGVGMAAFGGIIYALSLIELRFGIDVQFDDKITNLLIQFEKQLSLCNELDILHGLAGAAMCLVYAFHYSKKSALKPHIKAVSKRLCRQSTELIEQTTRHLSSPLNGFAHGLAGIGTALCVTSKIIGEKHLSVVGLKLLELESKDYAVHLNNWPDHRLPSGEQSPDQVSAWCHGTLGIGLSRYHLKNVLLNNAPNHFELDIAQTNKRHIEHFQTNDIGICHGTAGELELLIYNNGYKNRDQCATAVTKIIKQLQSATIEHGFGLMTGIAGVGYQLMRLTDARKFPSLMTFEDFLKPVS